MKKIAAVLLVLFAAACGDDGITKRPLPPGFNTGTADAGNADGGLADAGSPDGGSADAGNNVTPAMCNDGVQNQDETDVDCGGLVCLACAVGEVCVADRDCNSNLCEGGLCADQPLPTGAQCATSEECASGTCKDFGGRSICTESCQTTCPGQNLACFRNECVPNDYCDDPDGFGFGPGCMGQPCDRCDSDATCSEQNDGSFTCMCNDGFTGDGTVCADIDECAAGSPCDPNATCTNTPGSYTCACAPGFTGDGTICADVDECGIGTDNCSINAACTNLAGTFSCACDAGYTGDGVTCNDVDECAMGTDNCDVNATCSNTDGSFSCACNAGFTGDGVTCSAAARGPNVGEIVITEIMQNPSAQLDSDGEWFELHNASFTKLDLNGCRILSGSSTGDDEFTIVGLADVAAGDYIVFARSTLFGGTYDYVYNGAINLNNSTDDLELRCVTSSGFEQVIDSVAWDDGATFPDPNGASMSLDAAVISASLNDFGVNWCEGTASYYLTDQGTPGSANALCP